ncbi:MAG: type II toxin-antitoxin system RelE/ParE family toxin [Bacteroidales bacterium]
MSYKVETTSNFDREAKKLAKKYPSLKNDLAWLFNELETNPTMGTHIGSNIYKIRIAIQSKGKGKSGGARIMSYVKIVKQTVFLFSIYSKGEKDNISDREILNLVKEIPL